MTGATTAQADPACEPDVVAQMARIEEALRRAIVAMTRRDRVTHDMAARRPREH